MVYVILKLLLDQLLTVYNYDTLVRKINLLTSEVIDSTKTIHCLY